jgi:hypothetical protein
LTVLDPYGGDRRSKLPWVVAASVVLVGAVALIWATMSGSDETSLPTSSGSTPPTSGSELSAEPDRCPAFPDAAAGAPVVAPAADWIHRGLVTIPMAPSGPHSTSVSGPTLRDDDKPLACFAPTPSGALFGAVAAAADSLNPPTHLDWARERVVGPGRDAAVAAAASISATATSDGRQIQITAFRIDDCTSRRCVVQLAFDVALTDGTVRTGVGTAVMVWSDGDWRYYEDGIPDQPRFADPSALQQEGFVAWSP